jgi:hypothetical protein
MNGERDLEAHHAALDRAEAERAERGGQPLRAAILGEGRRRERRDSRGRGVTCQFREQRRAHPATLPRVEDGDREIGPRGVVRIADVAREAERGAGHRVRRADRHAVAAVELVDPGEQGTRRLHLGEEAGRDGRVAERAKSGFDAVAVGWAERSDVEGEGMHSPDAARERLAVA